MSGAYPSLIGYLSTLKVQNFDVVQQARGRSNLGLAAVAATGSASDLTVGTLADARLSSNVPLKNAANAFTNINDFNQLVRAHNGLQVTANGLAVTGGGSFSANVSIAGALTSGFLTVTAQSTFNNAIYFPSDIWMSDLAGLNRLHFATGGSTWLRGHGLIPITFRNASNVQIATISTSGQINAADSFQAEKYRSNVGDYIQGSTVSGTPWTFLTASATALGVKVGTLVVSDSYANTAPTNGLYVKGASTLVGGATISSGLTVFGSVNAGFGQVTGGVITAKGTIFTGYYEWLKNDVRQAYMGYDSGTDITLTNQAGRAFVVAASGIKVGSSSGPLLKTTSGYLWIRNSDDNETRGVIVNDSIVTSNEGGSFASPAVVGVHLQSSQAAYSLGGIFGRSYSANAGHGDVFVWANPVISTRDYSNRTEDLAIRGLTGNVEINRGNLRIGTTGGPRLKNNSGTLQVKNDGGTAFASLESNFITSAFQSLSADPSTLDISSGMSRLVKNTTSGEIRHWVNDGGTMKKSPAYT